MKQVLNDPDAVALYLGFYRVYALPELRWLRDALDRDRRDPTIHPETRAFCDWRIALIDRVVLERPPRVGPRTLAYVTLGVVALAVAVLVLVVVIMRARSQEPH